MNQLAKPIDLAISGMTCASCVARIEKSLRKVPGVNSVSVNLATESAHIEGNGSLPALIAAVVNIGYGAVLRSAAKPANDKRELAELAAALLLSAPLALGMVLPIPGWLAFALATPVQFWLGARFYAGAFKSIHAGSADMDVLVALGTSAAYVLSAVDFFTHGPLYFESAALIITFIRLGKYFEERAKREAAGAITGLAHLRPATARLADGTTRPIATLTPGMDIDIRPGERVPADGTILAGAGSLDESFLTGESLPVRRTTGGAVLAGSLNLDGALRVRVTALPGETLLDRMARLIDAAQSAKPAVQKWVDKIAAIFVPIVLLIAAATFLGWLLAHAPLARATLNAVSVLVIACPCALGLATPAAILAATGAGARHGILIRDAGALQTATRISLVVFDKTGTLTEGRPRLHGIQTCGSLSEPQVRSIAAALAAGDTHPLSAALRQTGAPPATHFQALPGRGVRGEVNGTLYLLGAAALITNAGGTIPATALPPEATLSYLATADGSVLAAFAFTDTIKPTAARAIARLHAAHIKTMLLSGDRRRAVTAAVTALHIDKIIAEATPAVKRATLRAAQKAGDTVAMVGDGINDAAALATANLGIAMGTGADTAIENAAIALLRPDPNLVPDVLNLARAYRAILLQGLFWALFYNAVGIPLAAFGFLTPVIAGAAMAASSVCVLGNALRLRRWKPQAT